MQDSGYQNDCEHVGLNTEDLAPILVSVYDRKTHLEQCIEALKRNDLAKESILYVVSDGPARIEDEASVIEVRNYIESIVGFKDVRPIIRDSNWGAYNSCMAANRYVLKEHGCMIRMEDDVICGKHYLKYLNEALILYADDLRVFSIAAHIWPGVRIPKDYPHDVYLWSRFSGWGYAIWRDRFMSVDLSAEAIRKIRADKAAMRRYHRLLPDNGSREASKAHIMPATDIRFDHYMCSHQLYTVYPVQSLTRNIGHDGTGIHCGKNKKLQKQVVFDGPIILTKDLEPNKDIYKKIYWSRFSFSVHVVGRLFRYMGIFDPCYRLYRMFRGLPPLG